MLSPTTRTVLGETADAMKRRRDNLHLTVHETRSVLDRAATEIARLDLDIAAVTADLARDDQARADAGEAFTTETITLVDDEPADDEGLVAELLDDLVAATRPPVSLTGSHLTTTTTAQEG